MADAWSLDDFKRWKVDVLRNYCRVRGLTVSSRRKDELVALAFAAHCQDLPIVADKVHEKQAVNVDYSRLLVLANGTAVPDPLKLSSGWLSEKEAVQLWPPCMILNISDYLVEKGERPLCERLRNDYKEGQ